MKRGKLWGAVALFLAPLFLWVGLAGAQTFRSGNSSIVPASETVNSTLYAAGNNVDVAGTVNGDVICAGQNVSVSGTVNGDVICAGQSVHVSGTVTGDVRLAGQTVSVGGDVKGNASIAAQTFTLEGDGKIGRDVGITAANATLNGTVGRDVAAAGNRVVIATTVGRNVTATIDRLVLRDQAVIKGDLEYTSSNDAELEDGARVAGTTTRHQPPADKASNYGKVFGFGLGFGLYMVLSLLLLAVALVLLFPSIFNDASAIAIHEPLKTFLIGLLATIVVPVLIVALGLTIIGIPLALFLLIMWLVVLLWAGPMFSYYLGRLILRDNHPVLMMVVGALIVLVTYLIPILGVLVLLAVVWMGVGMFLREAMRRTPRPSYAVSDARHGERTATTRTARPKDPNRDS